VIWFENRLRYKETIKGKVHNWFTMGFLKGRIGFAGRDLMTCDH
jgi:hypothetical protein